MYTTMDFYISHYRGTVIPLDAPFEYYCNRATAYLRNITQDKIEQVNECYPVEVQLATCELCEIIYKAENNQIIASETVGKISTTYVNNTKSIEQQKYDVVQMYLGHTNLLYRGV